MVTGQLRSMAVPECPAKATSFDQQHKAQVHRMKNHAGAKELAGHYTTGQYKVYSMS